MGIKAFIIKYSFRVNILDNFISSYSTFHRYIVTLVDYLVEKHVWLVRTIGKIGQDGGQP